MDWRSAVAAFFVASSTILCGCGGSDFAVAPVSGKVLCQGVPVTSGTIIFRPIPGEEAEGPPGKPASAPIKSDGTFVLTTYELHDGAIVGKHKVTYQPVMEGEADADAGEGEEGEAEETQPVDNTSEAAATAKPTACQFGGEATAVVKSGENELTIELSPITPEGEARAEEFAF